VRDPVKGLIKVQRYYTKWAPSRLRGGNGISYCGQRVEDRVSGHAAVLAGVEHFC